LSETYRAILCEQLGPPELLRFSELARQPLAPGQVRVAIRAAGVNFPDLLQIAGSYQHKPPLPFTPGFEAAGDIVEVGAAVTRWRIGDAVILRSRGGAYAEEVAVEAQALLPKPPDWSYEEAAAFPVAAATAWVALVPRGRLRAGETLLVLGAGGGTGLGAVALGARMGATVLAVASSAGKRAAALAAGARGALDPADESWIEQVRSLTQGRGADVVFDPVGGELFAAAWRGVANGGRYLVVGFAAGQHPKLAVNRLLLREAELIGVRAGEQGRRDPALGRQLGAALAEQLVSGQGRPFVGGVYRLPDAAAALRLLAERRAVGKLVLQAG
jgi:NADPH2:quinone reductase